MKRFQTAITNEVYPSLFSYRINDIVETRHGLAKEAGWWTDQATGKPLLEAAGRWKNYVISGKLALVHSEVSEALEGERKDQMDDKLPHRKMVEVELADALIRICDLAGAMGMDLGGAVAEKLAYNVHREDHHPENRAKDGGKKF